MKLQCLIIKSMRFVISLCLDAFIAEMLKFVNHRGYFVANILLVPKQSHLRDRLPNKFCSLHLPINKIAKSLANCR